MIDGDFETALASALKKFSEDGPEEGSILLDELFAKYPRQRDKILRERSQAFLVFDMFEDALNDRRTILDGGAGTTADYYFAGEYALQCGRFRLSRDLFDQAIECSLNSGSSFYLQSSRLLAALASQQLHEDARCLDYMDVIDDQVEVLWLKGFDRVSKKILLEMINRQQS